MGGFQQVDVARNQFDSKGLELAIQSMTQNLNNFYSTGTINEIGAIVAYGGTLPPTGFLLCDGSAISRATFSALFAVLGTSYGVGDGSTTFNLPDLKGRVPVGRDSGQTEFDTMGEKGGHKLLQAHTHTYPIHAFATGNGGQAGNTNQALWTNGSTASTGGGNAENLQPYQVVNYIIRYALPASTNAIQSKYIDTNGWTVYDYGYWKEYSKTFQWNVTVATGSRSTASAQSGPTNLAMSNVNQFLSTSWWGNYGGHCIPGVDFVSTTSMNLFLGHQYNGGPLLLSGYQTVNIKT